MAPFTRVSARFESKTERRSDPRRTQRRYPILSWPSFNPISKLGRHRIVCGTRTFSRPKSSKVSR